MSQEKSLPGLKDNLDALTALVKEKTNVIFGQAQELRRSAALEAMSHRNDPKHFQQRASEYDDASNTLVWVQKMVDLFKAMPKVGADSVVVDEPQASPHQQVANFSAQQIHQQPPSRESGPAVANVRHPQPKVPSVTVERGEPVKQSA
jgi:hypothetical protein